MLWSGLCGTIITVHTECDTVQSGTQYQCYVKTGCPHLQVQKVIQNLSRATGSPWIPTQPQSCSFLSYIMYHSFHLSYPEHGGSQFLQNVRNVEIFQHGRTASHP